MIGRIRSHSLVNGVAFVIWEFVLCAVIVAPLAVIWAMRGQALYSIAAAGIGANCLCIIAVGVEVWRSGQRGTPIRHLFDSAYRARLATQHPHMSEDTLWLTLSTLVPFGLTLLTLADLLSVVRSSK